MKITGAEWKEFEKTGWPEGYVWYEDSVFEDGTDLYLANGNIRFADAETFVLPESWCIVPESLVSSETLSLRSVVKRWRKVREFVMLVVTVTRGQEEAAKKLIASAGWKC
jgi:hypothetical protein